MTDFPVDLTNDTETFDFLAPWMNDVGAFLNDLVLGDAAVPSYASDPALTPGTPLVWINTTSDTLKMSPDGVATVTLVHTTTSLTENVQDVVAGMVTAVGGTWTYDDTAGTLEFEVDTQAADLDDVPDSATRLAMTPDERVTVAAVADSSHADLDFTNNRPIDLATWSMGRGYESLANGTVLTSNQIYVARVPVWVGLACSGIAWFSAAQVPSGLTVQISGIHDEDGILLRQSTDRGSTAWPQTTWGDFTLTSNYTFTYNGFSYVSLKITATTQVPSLQTRTFAVNLASNSRGTPPSPDNRVYCGTAQTVSGATMPDLTLPLTAVGSLPVVGLIKV